MPVTHEAAGSSPVTPAIRLRLRYSAMDLFFVLFEWVISSVGRASPLQGEGRQFEPVITHHLKKLLDIFPQIGAFSFNKSTTYFKIISKILADLAPQLG